MKAVIFDMDGTLLDSMTYWYDSGKKVVLEYLPDNAEIINKMNNMSAKEIVHYASSLLTPSDKAAFTKRWREMMVEHYSKDIKMKDGVLEYLDSLRKQGIPMCIATATPQNMANDCLKRLKIDGYFSFIIDEAMVGVGKYKPDIYLEAARRLNVNPSECAVFEDNVRFSSTAKNAGFITFGVYDELSAMHEETMREFCDKYIKSFRELL